MKYKILLYALFLLLPITANLSHAAKVADPNDPIYNDIEFVPADDIDNTFGYFVNRLRSYAVGTDGVYIFNDGGGTGTAAGAVRTRGMTNRTLQIDITNMQEPGTNTVGIFGANGTITPTVWATLAEINYNGTVTTSGTQSSGIAISEPYDWIRIGAKRSGDTSADFTIKESYNREAKR